MGHNAQRDDLIFIIQSPLFVNMFFKIFQKINYELRDRQKKTPNELLAEWQKKLALKLNEDGTIEKDRMMNDE